MIQVVTRKDGLTECWDQNDAVQAVPNEDWLYLYDDAGQICAMYFSPNVVSVKIIEKAGEQTMTNENTGKTGG